VALSTRAPRWLAAALALTLGLLGLTAAVSPPRAAAGTGNPYGAGIVAGGVYVPDGAAVIESGSYFLFLVVNGGKLWFQNNTEVQAMGYGSGWYVVPPGSLQAVPNIPNEGTMVKERDSPAVWFISDGQLHLVPNPDVFFALGYDWWQVHTVPNGSLGLIPRGPDVSPADVAGEAFNGTDRELLASGYVPYDTDTMNSDSANGKARLSGGIKWYHGQPPRGYIHRGNLTTGSKVEAIDPVGCIYAQLRWNWVTGGVSFPPGASISGASEVGQFFRSCTSGSETRPSPINLSGLGYARALLDSVTITVCNSAQASDGPRNCSYTKFSYGGN
jgi:hypothetical protein